MQVPRDRMPAIRRHALSTAIALAVAVAGPALAQEAAQPGAPAAAAASAGGDASAQDAVTLDQIVVTANKRKENIREVATSVSVISERQLENLNATQLSDYSSYVPGLQLQSSGTPGQTQVSMRGIAALSPGSTVGTYVDETPIGSNNLYQQATLYALDLLPYDVERVEVLRGPQGTLYGAGAMGGLIKYALAKPDPTMTEFRVGAGLSDTQGAGDLGWDYRLGMNVPLVDDSLALRASYASNHIAGYVDNLVDGRKDINDGKQSSGRVSLLWQGEAASVQFAAMQQKVDSENNAAIALDPVSFEPVSGLSNYVYVDEPFKKDLDYYSLTVDWDVGFADFVSATSYSDTHTVFNQDLTVLYGELFAGFGFPGVTHLQQTLDMNQFTQEFRLQSRTGERFEWLVGAFYDKEDGDNHQFIPLTQVDGSPLPPFLSAYSVLGEVFIPSSYKETALFGNASYKFTDRFKLGAGVRFSQNDQDFVQDATGPLIINGRFPNSSSENVFTWSITPQFQVTPDTMVYAKAATGYQPGGPNVVAPGLPPTVDSSTLTSYELGLKTAFDNRLLLDVVAYQIDWQDIQVASQVNGVSGLVNGGQATSRGLEASLTWRPVDGLTFGLNGAYNDANIDEDFPTITATGVDPVVGPLQVDVNTGLKGDRMPYVPDLTWSLTADYYVPLANGWGADFGGGLRWVDERTNSTTNRQVTTLLAPPPGFPTTITSITEPLVIDSYWALDLYAGISNEHWSLRTYLKNATDERGYSSMNDMTFVVGPQAGTTHHIRAVPIQPRTFGIEVDYRF